MSFPRLGHLVLPIALALPLLTGACGAPIAVTAASYGTDVGSLAVTGKSGSDHFASMVSKRDCALWRIFRNESICHDRDGDKDPYNVNYNEPFREAGEGGVEYSQPARATAGTPTTSWTASAYEAPPAAPAETPAAPVVQTAELPPPPGAEAAPVTMSDAKPAPPAKVKKPKPVHSAAKHPKKKPPATVVATPKPSPDQAASRT